MRPVAERWLDIALVVDGSRSMEVWSKAIAEIELLLARHGAFGHVRRWRLLVEDKDVVLESPTGRATSSALNDPRRRTLILIVTNGVADFWNNSAITAVLDDWSQRAPVAILQMFPERYWPYTALGPSSEEIRAILPGDVAAKLQTVRRRWQPLTADRLLAIPIVSTAPEALLRWAESTMAFGGGSTPAVLFRPSVRSESTEPFDTAPEQTMLNAESRVKRFRSIASPEAFHLVTLLSAVPLTLPVMRIVQEQMSSPRLDHLAEVMASGLVQRVTPADNTDPDYVFYEFVHGVRDVLQNHVQLTPAGVVHARVQPMLREFLIRRMGRSIDNFRAFVLDDQGDQHLPSDVHAFLEIERRLLDDFGLRKPRTEQQRVVHPVIAPSVTLKTDHDINLVKTRQPHTLVNDLRAELAAGGVLVVAGAGVAMQATDGEPCATWDGLLEHGIEWCASRRFVSEDEASALREQLKSGSVDQRLAVAERVSEALGAPHGGEFRRWLGESVGKLRPKQRAILDAIHDLGAPVATTNYDNLLTHGRGLAHVPWTDGPAAHEIFRGHRDAVLHFHGCYDHPESVVLGVRSYEKVLASGGAQAIQRASLAGKTLLFIGCGDGLSDPNFGALLQWSADVLGGSIYRHYCLCLEDERDSLQKRMPPDVRLFYVEYGSSYDDLVPFLRLLVPPKASYVLPNPGYCFGREREVAEVVDALLAAKPQPLPILGGPGMGKTTIALTALHERPVAERFGARRWFVRCDGVKTRNDLAGAIARTLELPITPAVEQTVIDELVTAPAALVLDNAETPLDADGPQVEELLSMLANIEALALVVTIRGHRRPRGVPWRASTEAQRLTDKAAAETFVAVSGKPRFASEPDLSRLLVALDGVPLAITLMARFAEVFESLKPVWQRWTKKRADMLRDGEEPDRLKNIAVSYELSIGVLSAPARRLLSVLAMLPGGLVHVDLEGVFADPHEAADELRRRALVFEEGPRLRMLAPLREYVMAAHAWEDGDGRRAMEHYLKLAGSEGRKVGKAGGAGAVSRLVPEMANMEAMLAKSVSVPYDHIARSVDGWTEFMRFTGLGSPDPIAQIAEHAIAGGDTVVAARCVHSLGKIALAHSDYEGARARFEQALPLWRIAGRVRDEAYCIQYLGDIAYERDDLDTARAQYELALPLFRKEGSVLGEANCILSLAGIAAARSERQSARAQYEEALRLYQKVDDMLGAANCMLSLGDLALDESDFEGARARYEQALPLYQEVGSLVGEGNSIRGLGQVVFGLGDPEEAEAKFRQALAIYEQCRAPFSIGSAHLRLARVVAADAARSAHVAAARDAWLSIKRDDLVAKLDAEFGTG